MKKLAVLFCLIFAACSSKPTPIEGFGPAGSNSYPIINGTPAGGLAEHDAVVGLHRLTKRRGGSIYILPFCTGTLISPTVVLTAAHCLDKAENTAPVDPLNANELAIYVGDSPATLDENGDYDLLNNYYLVDEVLIFSGYDKFNIDNDIGLVRLRSPINSVTPVSHLDTAQGLTASDEGTLTLNIVGFGQNTPDGDHGVKLQANVTLNSVGSTVFDHSHTPEGICFGDSGGPALLSRDGGSTYLAGGVASYVTYPYCEDTGAHTRVDAFNTFIDEFLNPTSEPPPPSTCELLPLGASCSDDSECCSNKCKGRGGNKTCK